MNNKYGYNYIFFTLFCTLFKIAVVYCNSYGCEDGWTLNGTKCYFVSTGNNKENRDKSQKICDDMDSTLVTVASNETHDFIMGLRDNDKDYWIGLKVYGNTYDKSNWHWSDGTNNTLDKWSSADDRDEACGFLKVNDSPDWRSSDCHEERFYICQTEFTPQGGCRGHQINQKCFIAVTDKLYINTEAATVCIDNHKGTLAAFADDTEWDFLKSKLGWHEYWIGLFALTWDDETTYDWHNWQNGDGPNTNDKCVYINDEIDGEWQSHKCTGNGNNDKRLYICQRDAEIIQPTTAVITSPSTSSTTSSPATTTLSTTATTEFITHEVTSSITTERSSDSSSTPTSSEMSTTANYISTTTNNTDEASVTNTAMEIAFYIILTCDVLAAIAFVVLFVIYRRVKTQAEKNSIVSSSTSTYYNITEVTGQTKQEPADSIDNHLYMADSSTIIHRKGAV